MADGPGRLASGAGGVAMEIRNNLRQTLDDLRKSTSWEEMMNGAVDDIEHYANTAARAVDLLNKLLSNVKRTPSGDYCIARGMGIVLVPMEMNEALKEIEAFLSMNPGKK